MTTQQDIETMVAEAYEQLPAGSEVSIDYSARRAAGSGSYIKGWYGFVLIGETPTGAWRDAPREAIEAALSEARAKIAESDAYYAGICGVSP